MIYRVLTQFNQNPDKNQDFKEHKLLTINILIVYKDQLISFLVARIIIYFSAKCGDSRRFSCWQLTARRLRE